MMKPQHTLYVLTNNRGKIIAAGSLPEGDANGDGIHVRITPLKGQSLVAVSANQELGPLESEEDFRRLVATFHLPKGKKVLARKRPVSARKKPRKASRPK